MANCAASAKCKAVSPLRLMRHITTALLLVVVPKGPTDKAGSQPLR